MATTDEETSAGEVVRLRREELGLTKTELARRARITRSSVHEIEAGARAHLQARTMRRLEEALGLSPGSLEPRVPSSVFVSHAMHDALSVASLRHELEEALGERRYDSLLELIMRVADRIDELEERLPKRA